MSRAMPFFKCYAGDFLSGIRDLSPVQTNAYIRLIFRMYDDADGVFGDSRFLGRMMGSNAKGWEKVRDVLLAQGKIVPVTGDPRGDGYINIRALTEMLTVCAESRKRGKPIPHNVEQRLAKLCGNLGEAYPQVTTKFSNFLNKIKAPKESLKPKLKLEKTPNPLKGDDAALGCSNYSFQDFYDGYPLPNKRNMARAASQWEALDETSRDLAVQSLPYAKYDFAKRKNGGPTPAVYLRARWFDQFRDVVVPVPKDPQTRKLYDIVTAKDGVIGWKNHFTKGVEMKGHCIIVPSDFRRSQINKRLAKEISAAGFELVSSADETPLKAEASADRPSKDETEMAEQVRCTLAQLSKALGKGKPRSPARDGAAMFSRTAPPPPGRSLDILKFEGP